MQKSSLKFAKNYARLCLQAMTLLGRLYCVQLLLRQLFPLGRYLEASFLIYRNHAQIYSLAYSFEIDGFLSVQHHPDQVRLHSRTFVGFSNFALT